MCPIAKYRQLADIASQRLSPADDWVVNDLVGAIILFACISCAFALGSLERKRLWLIAISIVDLGLMFWTLVPYVGMNY